MTTHKNAARVAVVAEPCLNGAVNTPWTPEHHATAKQPKPIKLLELGMGNHGKCARFVFPEGWERCIDLPTEADAYHPLFDDLPSADRTSLRKHAESPVVTGANGVKTQQRALSFTTRTVGRGGYTLDINEFDIPEESYCDGFITGYRCAGELLEALKRGYGPHIDARSIVRAVVQASNNKGAKFSRHGAAAAFLTVVNDALKFLATHGAHGKYIAGKVEQAQEYAAGLAKHEAQEKAAFVERMRQAKAAKSAARGGAA
jgi:hypothetical protein